MATKKEDFLQVLKFVLFSASAGVIQMVSFTLLNELVVWPSFALDAKYGPNYFIALVLSVIWNFTFNRKFTFKSANNIPIAMLKVFAYYCVFTPLSIWWGIALTRIGWNEYLVLILTMIVNMATEYLVCRFFVFGKSINTNDLAKKQQAKLSSQEETNQELKQDEIKQEDIINQTKDNLK
ncbi:MAG: GtrA family protein [Clostridia bacterium]